MKNKYLILVILIITVPGYCFSQNLYFQSYSSAQGLSQNSVFSIAQTKDGFMWFGTQDGINRFDGKNFTYITPYIDNANLKEKGLGKFSKEITALYADKKDWLWVGTSSDIAIYNRYTSKFILPSEVYKGFSIPVGLWINTITEDSSNNIWIHTKDDGLFCYNKLSGAMVSLKWQGGVPAKYTRLCNTEGDIWVSTEKKIYQLKNGSFIPVIISNHLLDNKEEIIDMAIVNKNPWLVLNTSKVIVLQQEAGSSYVANNFVTAFKGKHYLAEPNFIHQSDSNTVWIGSRSDGLLKINLQEKTFENAGAFGTIHSLKSPFILSFYTNLQKITWIGLSGGGIAKYDLQKIQFGLWRNEPDPQKAVPDNMLLSVFSENDEDFYMGTLRGGLLHKNIKNGSNEYYLPPVNKFERGNKNIYGIIPGENGSLWVATSGGLYSFNKKTKAFVLYTDTADRQTRELCAVIQLKDKNKLLIGGYNGGLRIFNIENHTWEKCADAMKILEHEKYKFRVRYMKEMNSGDVYLSTEAQNLVKYNYISGTFTFFPQFEKQSGTSRYFYFDSLYLWIATDDGLIQADPVTMQIIKSWNTENGLANNYIYAVIPDNYGRIWISSNGGLSMIDYKAGICKNFTEDDGLQGMEFNTASCYKDKSGKIWFGGISGLNMVNPELSAPNNFSPAPLITNINVMNVPFQSDTAFPYIRSISLPYSKNFISFEFQSPNFSQSENIIYEYQLKGVDTGWVKNGTRNFISYTQLKPGHYTFMVRSANTNYVWSKSAASISIIIIPPWYQTWWFYLLAVTGIIAVIFLLLRQRFKSIRYKAEARQKIIETEMAALKAQMNPHFMFNCINSIDAFIHSNDKYNATLYLNKFAKLLRNILDSSKENTVALTKDIETLKFYIELEELRHENKFTTSLIIDDELLANDYKVPPLIIQPFIENAILHGIKNKYDNNGLLSIDIRKVNNKIQYTVTDNGIGRNAAAKIKQNKESHYGMQMSYDRIKLFNKEETASVQVEDIYRNGIAAGTTVIVNLNII